MWRVLLLISTLPSVLFNTQQTKILFPKGSAQWVGVQFATIIVPDNYTRIQDAINNANERDIVYVRAGVYYEHLIITKPILLVGESKNSTIVDGNGSGSVIQVYANNVSVVNFTVRNAGGNWSGSGQPPSCIACHNVRYITITNNILTSAAVCIWLYLSSFVDVSCNNIFNSTVAGIIGYTSSRIIIRQNLLDYCGLMGIHLDGNSANCNITGNTVINTLEAIEIEKSAGNFVAQNRLFYNNASIVLNQCSGLNIFRENNMISDWYNIIVWGFFLNAFRQDFDATNTVNGKKVYYFANSRDLVITPLNYPDIGYLAVVNCINITVRDVDLSFNKDGLLLAQSNNCALENVTIHGNKGPLLYGGLTLFNSSNNIVIRCTISNNHVGVCTYKSDWNIFYHNTFDGNTKHVILNYYSPFQQPSTSTPYSTNIWDNGYLSGGNYWSNYCGMDLCSGFYQNETGSDGVGDLKFRVDSNSGSSISEQFDNYPLMGPLKRFKTSLGHFVEIISNSTIEGFRYFESNNTIFMLVSNVTVNQTHGFCRLTIPHRLIEPPYTVIVNGDPHSYRIIYQNVTEEISVIYFSYEHSQVKIMIVSEFSSKIALTILMSLTILIVVLSKKVARLKGKL